MNLAATCKNSCRWPAGIVDVHQPGLEAARRALRRGGSWAVWSGYPADAFPLRLREAGLRPSVVTFQERGKVQARAYFGKKP